MKISVILAFGFCLTGLHVNNRASAGDDIKFNRDIRPILSRHCLTCHGPDAQTREAGLRLDDHESATAELDSGEFAIVPFDAEASELISRITSSDYSLRMPPEESGDEMTPEEIEKLQRWIDQGATYETHWAFIAPQLPEIPGVNDSQWVRNAVDHFTLAKMQSNGITPSPEASRETLIRRVAFDLTGLPPTIGEIDRFLKDDSDDAYESMVERYLDSSAYGEHMASAWLDLARYADSNGYQYDTERQQWVWRDWVIDAFNRNVPFDQFSIEQLAGDLIPNASPQQRLATGFNRNHGITIEGGVIDEEYRVEYVMDRVVTTSNVWLGLSMGCARCHDHKFDPISQREFYELYAYFNQVPERGNNGFDPREQIASPFAAERNRLIESEIAQLRSILEKPIDTEIDIERWADSLSSHTGGWRVLEPTKYTSTGGSKIQKLDDHSLLVGEANPDKDSYEIWAEIDQIGITAIRLEALTHESLPGGGPGRHSNSNFVLSEFELVVTAASDADQKTTVRFTKATADYSQSGYEIAKAIDGTVAGNNGWAVDGPTRKQPATALFAADEPFGFEGGSVLQFKLRHEAGFRTHGIGRPRLSVTTDAVDNLRFDGPPLEIRDISQIERADRSEAQQKRLVAYYLEHHSKRAEIEAEIAALSQSKNQGYPATMVMRDQPQIRTTHVLDRGQYDKPTDAVTPNVPSIFPSTDKNVAANRLQFANWLFAEDHPMTARVAVNRHWQQVFGIGLVKTLEDFGVQGEPPSHLELLDWLALEYVRSNWDTKHMFRLILHSATYRQSSAVGEDSYQRDPENRLLSRGPRIRLSAEALRDQALAVSDLLVNQVGGRSVYPYQPKGLWMELNNRPGYSKEYPQGTGDDLYRRSVYTFWKRTVPSPMLKTFDAPNVSFVRFSVLERTPPCRPLSF